jgi:hypothetical protein
VDSHPHAGPKGSAAAEAVQVTSKTKRLIGERFGRGEDIEKIASDLWYEPTFGLGVDWFPFLDQVEDAVRWCFNHPPKPRKRRARK